MLGVGDIVCYEHFHKLHRSQRGAIVFSNALVFCPKVFDGRAHLWPKMQLVHDDFFPRAGVTKSAETWESFAEVDFLVMRQARQYISEQTNLRA